MIRLKHPSRYFIHYLISRRVMGTEEIVAQLIELGLPVPRIATTPKNHRGKGKGKSETPYEQFVGHIRTAQLSAEFPPGFTPHNAKHDPSRMWLRKNRVVDLWDQDRAAIVAYDLLLDPQVSRMLMILLLGPLSFRAIADRVQEKFDMGRDIMNPRVVRAFAHYFWNYELLNISEWKTILQDWMSYDTTDMLLAVQSPRSNVGAALTICMADQGVSESLKEVVIYRHMRDTSFMEFAKASVTLRTGVAKATAMLQLVEATVKGQEQLDQRRGGSAELLEELRRIEATYDPAKLTTIRELPLDRLPETIDITDYEIKEEQT